MEKLLLGELLLQDLQEEVIISGLLDQRNGENTGKYTMRKPSIRNLKIDIPETKRIRSAMTRQKSVKITINIDSATLSKYKSLAEESGVPYQRLINKTLAESLVTEAIAQSRIEKIEKELKALRKKIAA